jgi:hypothetical protein
MPAGLIDRSSAPTGVTGLTQARNGRVAESAHRVLCAGRLVIAPSNPYHNQSEAHVSNGLVVSAAESVHGSGTVVGHRDRARSSIE